MDAVVLALTLKNKSAINKVITITNDLETKVAALEKGFKYKGAVNYYKDLPKTANEGDVYSVLYKGIAGTNPDGSLYVWGNKEGQLTWIRLAGECNINSISKNGTPLDIINGNVDITVPTKTSELENDSDFAKTDDIKITKLSINSVELPIVNKEVNIKAKQVKTLKIDNKVTAGSLNLIRSGAVAEAIESVRSEAEEAKQQVEQIDIKLKEYDKKFTQILDSEDEVDPDKITEDTLLYIKEED